VETRLADALELCETTRGELLSLLDRATPDQWPSRPRPDGWTVAEQFDHLVKSEVGTSKMVRRLIRGDFKHATRPWGVKIHDSSLTAYPYGRLDAPAVLAPTALRQEEATELLAATHARFLEEVRKFEGDDSDGPAAPDPASGEWFSLAGWVRLQALHEAHHIAQIRGLIEG
jgi:hypothetical protein